MSLVKGINFIGEGTLTIKSKKPFEIWDADVLTIKITAGEDKSQQVNKQPEQEQSNIIDNNVEDKEQNDIMTIALIASISFSAACLIIIIILASKRRNN